MAPGGPNPNQRQIAGIIEAAKRFSWPGLVPMRARIARVSSAAPAMRARAAGEGSRPSSPSAMARAKARSNDCSILSSEAAANPLAMNTARTLSSTSGVVKERGRPRGRFAISVLIRIIILDSVARRDFCTSSHKNMEDAMELFASPMACSLASHITALEAGLPVKLRFVKDHKTDDGGDYYAIAANGYVPALRLDDG